MIRKRKAKRCNQKGRKIRRREDGSDEGKKTSTGLKRSPSLADESDNAQQRVGFATQEMFNALKPSDKIQIFNFGSSNFAVFNGIDLLLRHFRFLCYSVHRPKNESVAELPNVPVVLLPEQTQLLLENGFAKLKRFRNIDGGEGEKCEEKDDDDTNFESFPSSHFPQSVAYAVKLTVFRDLWRKGFYLADGAKFGCDYLAYRRPPPEQHSEFMVMCTNANDGAMPQLTMSPLNLIAMSRASTQVRKRILLAIVSVGSPMPYYLEMNWWKGDEE